MENRRPFGTMPDGTPVELLELSCGRLSCQIITYGGALRSLTVPDRAGQAVDVLLGFDTLEDYRRQDKYIGALIGRYANRIGGARFPLNGRDIQLLANDEENHLHGGGLGFDKQVWTVKSLSETRLMLTLFSPDGQEGYPGNLAVEVCYTLTAEGLEIEYEAQSDADTLCNLTNHAYFNLSGHQSGPVTEQLIQLPGQRYTPTGSGSIPTGALAPVEGSPMDLRRELPIGKRIDEDFPQLTQAGGYDHNWVVEGPQGQYRPAARARSLETGIALEVLTTLPGIQFYSGNYLDGCPAGKAGAPYARRWGFCLEMQYYPDSPNQPNFPSALLKAGQIYRQKTGYHFSVCG